MNKSRSGCHVEPLRRAIPEPSKAERERIQSRKGGERKRQQKKYVLCRREDCDHRSAFNGHYCREHAELKDDRGREQFPTHAFHVKRALCHNRMDIQNAPPEKALRMIEAILDRREGLYG